MHYQLFRVLLCVVLGIGLLTPGIARAYEMKPFECKPYDPFTTMYENTEVCTPTPFNLWCPGLDMELNNLGYRSTDGLLYGLRLTSNPVGNLGIYRVGADCNPYPYCVPAGLPANLRFDAGDISPDGRWMYINMAGISPLYVIDLVAADGGDCQVHDVVTWGANMGFVHDWTYNPVNGKLYGADMRDGQLAEIDLGGSPHARTDYNLDGGNLPTGVTSDDAYGGARYAANGDIIVYRNLGEEYAIDLKTMTWSTPEGCPDTLGRNDGATCWPWFCADEAFFIQDRDCVLCRCDPSTLPSAPGTDICGPWPGREINNIGYCRLHQKLYGIELTHNGNIGYVEIDPRTCELTNLGFGTFDPPTLRNVFTNQRFDAGDMSCYESTLFVNRAGIEHFFYKVDLTDPLDPKTVKLTVTGHRGFVHDWAFNPLDGRLYGGDDGIYEGLLYGELAILTPHSTVPDKWTREDVSIPGLPSGVAFGGAWFNSDGKLVLHRNRPDAFDMSLFEIDLNAMKIEEARLERGSLHNDGASCFPIRNTP